MQPGDPKPKVIHRDVTKERRTANRLLTAFVAAMRDRMEQRTGEGDSFIMPVNVDGPRLLEARKKLAQAIRKGMLERYDMELDIAIQAAVVWFCRQSEHRQRAMMDEW